MAEPATKDDIRELTTQQASLTTQISELVIELRHSVESSREQKKVLDNLATRVRDLEITTAQRSSMFADYQRIRFAVIGLIVSGVLAAAVMAYKS